MSKVFDYLGGRKMLLSVLVGVAVLVLGWDGNFSLSDQQVVDSLLIVLGIGAGSIALEDGLKKST